MTGALASAVVLLSGCAETVSGTATWPGAVLEKALLDEADFPPGVQYGRIVDEPGQPDAADGPGSMLSRPKGCANVLTNVIKESAERGPGYGCNLPERTVPRGPVGIQFTFKYLWQGCLNRRSCNGPRHTCEGKNQVKQVLGMNSGQ